MNTVQQEVDERTNLTGNNKFELLLFRLGSGGGEDRAELYGINVFKVREIVAMPEVTAIAGALPHVLGVVNLRGQIIQVIDLPAVVGCTPKTGLNIILVTEYARTTQAFAVESVEEIVRLNWSDVLSAEASSVGGSVTSIARIDGNIEGTRLAQVLDVEQIMADLAPGSKLLVNGAAIGPKVKLPGDTVILAADDSGVARAMIEASLDAMGAPYIMTKSGKEAWEKLQALAHAAEKEGKSVMDKVALVLTDLEMPEMDGFTLTRHIKQDARFKSLRVVIHSSLTGTTNEAHVKSVGADAYVAKFDAEELAGTLRNVLRS
ncbi:MAG: chemotaxis protein [Pseudomonadota bacterium]